MTDITMIDVARIRCRIAAHDWAFARDEAAAIDRHWADLVAKKPLLFNGRVLLSRDIRIDEEQGGALTAHAFEVAYKSFLGWRDFGFPGAPVHNLFAMPALRSADGAFMLGRMSAGTANAGKLYFPAGTPEPADAGPDGMVDFDANILRELTEETGLAATDVVFDPSWTIVTAGPLVGGTTVARARATTTELIDRVADFVAAQAHPELDGLVAVGSAADFDAEHMMPFMLAYLRAALSRETAGQAR